MKRSLPDALDGTGDVVLRLENVPDRGRAEQAVALGDRFLRAGGAGPAVPAATTSGAGPVLEIRWPSFPAVPGGLGVVIRLLTAVLGRTDAALTLEGRPPRNAPTDLRDLAGEPRRAPRARDPLPFPLEAAPSLNWLNLQILLDPPVDEAAERVVASAVGLWSAVAVAGGFQTGELDLPLPDEGEYGVDLGRAVVGDDFLEWTGPVAQVPPTAYAALLNLLAAVSERERPITTVSLG